MAGGYRAGLTGSFGYLQDPPPQLLTVSTWVVSLTIRQREAFKLSEMQKLFAPQLIEEATRVWRGIIHPARVWVPLLMISGGMRLREAAQLAVEDIVEIDGMWCARVTADIDEQGRRGRRRALKGKLLTAVEESTKLKEEKLKEEQEKAAQAEESKKTKQVKE